MELEKALIYTERFYNEIKDLFKKFDITGDLRRHKGEINTLEYIVIPNGADFDIFLNKQRKKGVLFFLNRKQFTRDILIDKEMAKITFYTANSYNYGLVHFLTTGTRAYTRELLKKWKKEMGGYSTLDTQSWASPDKPYLYNSIGEIIQIPDEQTLYKIIKANYLPPKMRYSEKEIKKLAQGDNYILQK